MNNMDICQNDKVYTTFCKYKDFKLTDKAILNVLSLL